MSRHLPRCVSALLFGLFIAVGTQTVQAADKPNIVYILADDLGYNELGCYGQKWIKTPNIDRIAAEGIRFTQHYSGQAVCAPSRCVLMTGKHTGHAYIRSNGNPKGMADLRAKHGWEFPGQHPIPDSEVTIAELLKQQGYATGGMGKWGLGHFGTSGDPNKQGFDLFYGFNCQEHAHNHYPRFLWRNGKKETLPGNDRTLNGQTYSQDKFTEVALDFIRQNKDRPFFLYLPFAIPHLSIQVPEQSLAQYKGKIPEADYKHRGYLKHPFPRAGYAAMVSHLDRDVGRVMSLLKELKLDENTLVMFTSDNGPTYNRLGGSDSEFFESAGPFRGLKGSLYEGGIRVPLVARWPGKIKPGSVTDHASAFWDVLPTICDLTGAPQPKGIDGISFAPTLLGQPDRQQQHEYLYWEFPSYGGQQAVRMGNWKAIRQGLSRGKGEIELYDLKNDVGEKNDVAGDHPDVVRKIRRIMQTARRTSALFPFPALDAKPFSSRFSNTHDRVWIGEQFWANPMEDWRINNGRLECITAGGDRNVHILTRQLGAHQGTFNTSVRIGRLAPGEGSAGFRIGIRDEIDDYRARLFHGRGINAGITTAGIAFIGQAPAAKGKQMPMPAEIELRLAAKPAGKNVRITLSAHDVANGRQFATVTKQLPAGQLVGNMALVNNPHSAARRRRGNQANARSALGTRARFWFSDWKISGTKVVANDHQTFGPILWAMHTLSRGVLKMTAQMPPVGLKESQTLRLQIHGEDGSWKTIAEEKIDPLARTATFRIARWDSKRNTPYRLAYTLLTKDGQTTEHHYTGTVRKDPVDKETIVVAAFTGNTDSGFPNNEIVRNVGIHNPDVLFFSGDQIYESVGGYGIIRRPADRSCLNYLRKWYMFGFAFRDLMRDRVTICLPDDHDVYQGNIWGNGGNATTMADHEAGGYAQPAEMVNAVHRTQTSHHPDLFDPAPIKQEISVFYGDMVYGRISFGIVADRMFKSGPKGTVATWKGRPDHLKDPNLDVRSLDKPGLKLLGDRQLKFLKFWAADWREADMKCVLSQTIFCNLANYHGGNKEYLIADLDSNGWPQTGRNKALAAMRRGFAFHLAGDQHLPSIVQHGIDSPADAGYSFCVPSIAAGYPRSWLPDKEGRKVKNRPESGLPNTGDYLDSFKNHVRVSAIGNPAEKNRPGRLRTLHDKSSGYGIVRFHKKSRTITIECWRLLFDAAKPKPADQFPGWPKTIDMLDNYARKAVAFLPTLQVAGMSSPVVQVIDESDGEIVYTLRIKGTGFRPKVFKAGKYTINIGEPGTDRMQKFQGVESLPVGMRKSLSVRF